MRSLITAAALAVIAVVSFVLWRLPPQHTRLEDGLWRTYANRFVTIDGRVIDQDSGAPGITHTEGQGYAMLLAEAAGDQRTFDLVWRWTRDHLTRPDGLLSWRYGPCGDKGGDCVTDTNNASDGDILVAWALLRAGKSWNRTDYIDASRAIASTVADRQIVKLGATTLLLPGSEGFVDGNAVVVNPSYWIFPAFSAFAAEFSSPIWDSLSDSSVELLRQARFGRWNLPPDWLRIDGNRVRLADGFSPQYGFNAVRVPLNLMWGGREDEPLLAPFRAFWSAPHGGGQVPAWVDLSDGSTAPYGWQTGMAAIAALAGGTALPVPGPDDGYFSWSLALLSRIAQAEKAK